MSIANYLYTPEDIAAYLLYSDLTYSEESGIIRMFFYTFRKDITNEYKDDIRKFRTEIRNLMALYELTPEEYSDVTVLLNDDPLSDGSPAGIQSYFKLIRLRLLFSGEEYVRIKTRNLLAKFGYRRRTPYVLDEIQKSLRRLSLRAYTRDYRLCDLKTVALDRMVMLRIVY